MPASSQIAKTSVRPNLWAKRLTDLPVIVLVLIAVFVSIYPVFWIFISSLKGQQEFTIAPMGALPQVLHWENYARVCREQVNP